MLSVLFFACQPASLIVEGNQKPNNTGNGDDSAVITDDSSADDSVPVIDDSGQESDPPDPEPVLSSWSGSRRFYDDWGACDETVTETGSLIDESHELFAAIMGECSTCTHIYEVTPDTDTVCWAIGLGTNYRALLITDGGTAVHVYSPEGDGTVSELGSDNSADFDGENLSYTYVFSYWGASVNVDGEVVLSEE
jgi:hypothetical protein